MRVRVASNLEKKILDTNPDTEKQRIKSAQKLRGLVKAHLLADPSAPTEKIIKATGCSPALVTIARKELRDSGFHTRAHGDHKTPTVTPTPADLRIEGASEEPIIPIPLAGTSDLMDLLDQKHDADGGEYTIEKQRKWLRQVQRDEQHPIQIRMAALQMYNKLNVEDVNERDALGPGAPLTDKERINRIALLMKSCGPKLVLKAYEEAFNVTAEATNAHIPETNTPQTIEAPSPTTPADGHEGPVQGTE